MTYICTSAQWCFTWVQFHGISYRGILRLPCYGTKAQNCIVRNWTLVSYSSGHISLGPPYPLSMLVVIARSSALQSTLSGATGLGGGECLLSGGSGLGMVLCNVRNGWPKHFGQDCRTCNNKVVCLNPTKIAADFTMNRLNNATTSWATNWRLSNATFYC